MSEQLMVEDHPELVRDSYSKGITNRDNSAYKKYMESYSKRKLRNSKIENTEREINNIKDELSEMKTMLRHLLEKVNGN